MAPPSIRVIAHRGSSGTAPENTMAAFREAQAAGAMMIEFDVRLSADGVPVIVHDRTLQRTTGNRSRVWEMSSAAVRRLDAGSRFGRRFAGEPVPMLEDVLAWRPAPMGLNVEVKTDGDPRGQAAFLDALLPLLRFVPADRLLVSSFDHRFLRLLHTGEPDLPLGALFSPIRDARRTPATLTRAVGGTTFICSRRIVRRRMVEGIHRQGLECVCYGVNSPRHALQARRLQLDGIITDHPARMIAALRES